MMQPPGKESIGFLNKVSSNLKKIIIGTGSQQKKLKNIHHPVLIIPVMGQITVVMGEIKNSKSATANDVFYMAEKFLHAGRETLREEKEKARKFVEELE